MFLSLDSADGGLVVQVQLSGPPGAPALLLLHSLGTTHAIWDGPAERLAGGFRLIRPDLRGHGLSGVTPGPYRIESLARDQFALLDALGVGEVIVAGVSIGGMIAQAMAATEPARVRALVLCATALAIPGREAYRERAALVRAEGTAPIEAATLARWVSAAGGDSPAASGLATMLRRTDREGYAASAEALAAADLTVATSALRLPTLVLVGEEDLATPPEAARALAAAIPGARLETVPRAAHIPTMEQPEAIAAAMLRFLAPAGERYEAGLAVRRAVLGEAHVARSLAAATDFDRDFQRFITETAWGGVWARPGLERRTRSLLTLAILAALGREEEFRLHLRATANTGASAAEIAEAMLHVAVYAGIPAANAAIRSAKEILREREEP